MENVELVIYIALTVIAAGLVLNFIFDLPLMDISKDLIKRMVGKDDQSFKRVDDTEFIAEMIRFWEDNQWSDTNATLLLYYKSEGTFTKRDLFRKISENNLCRTIQSGSFGCGVREDVVMEPIDLPSIVRLTYDDEKLFITPGRPRQKGNETRSVQITYIDGFVGNGVIVVTADPIPYDAKLENVRLEGMFGTDFDLFINGAACASTFITELDVDEWDITGCANLFAVGGFIVLEYMSLQPRQQPVRKALPKINGSINYFGSVDFAGPPQQMRFILDYETGGLNGSDFFVKVGNSTVYVDNSSGRRTADFTVPADILREGMNPVRIGIDSQASTMAQVTIAQPVDAVLITDTSGSMAFEIGADYSSLVDGTDRSCLDPLLMSRDTQKKSLAKCFAKEFVQIVLEKYRRNRIALVSFAQETKSYTNLTSDRAYLDDVINGYDAEGGTCVSCGIARATEILKDTDRARAMVIMTDGCANHIIPGTPTGGIECYDEQAFNEAKEKAQEARDLNISLFTIGFGKMDPVALQLLQDIACMDNCSNYGHGENATEIQEIYRNFAERIAKKQSVQTKHVQGSGEGKLTWSNLYESYIEYSPIRQEPLGRSVMVLERLGCGSEARLPQGVTSAMIISWAGTLWTVSAQAGVGTVFDMTGYGELLSIGDPFVFNLPLPINGTITLMAADVTGKTQCLDNYYLLYAATPDAGNNTFSDGCHWKLDINGDYRLIDVPKGYIGDRYCTYTRDAIVFNSSDLYQGCVGDLLHKIDDSSDGILESNVEAIYIVG
jgi:hypothetical protein